MALEASILKSIKPAVNVPADYTVFDGELIMDINAALSILHQVGTEPFEITGDTETWDDVPLAGAELSMVKKYVRDKVKLMFDPPASGTLVEILNKSCSEFESRISYATDPTEGNVLAV